MSDYLSGPSEGGLWPKVTFQGYADLFYC